MRNLLNIPVVCSIFLGLCLPAYAVKKPQITASTTDIASIASDLLGKHAAVNSVMNGGENPVFFIPEKRNIISAGQSDFFLKNGMGLETRWEKKFYKDVKNPKISIGATGNIPVTANIKTLPIKTTKKIVLDIYKEGNPFVWLDPVNGKKIARNITDYFCSIYPIWEKDIRSNLSKFNRNIDKKMVGWIKKMSVYKSKKVISYQHNFDYFAKRFNINIVDYVESEYELPPSEKRIRQIIAKIKKHHIPLLLITDYNSRRIPRQIVEQTGIKLLVLPTSVGSNWVKSYVQLFDYLINSFDQTMKKINKTD